MPENTGERGEKFRMYRRDFLSFARGEFSSRDDRFSYLACYMRQDEGGTDANAPAMPAGAHAQAAANRKAMRHGKAYKLLYDSTKSNSLRQMLADLATTNPAELPGDAWDLIVSECDDVHDDLELVKLNNVWNSATIMNTVETL